MVNKRRPEKNRIHWNHVSLNGFVIIVVCMQTIQLNLA